MRRNGTYEHLVNTLVDELKARGVEKIQSQRGGDYPQPERFFQSSTQRWFSPDVEVIDRGQTFFYEVETEETLVEEETRWRIEVLAGAANRRDALFYLVVPEKEQDTAQRLINEMHIQRGQIWGIVEGRKV